MHRKEKQTNDKLNSLIKNPVQQKETLNELKKINPIEETKKDFQSSLAEADEQQEDLEKEDSLEDEILRLAWESSAENDVVELDLLAPETDPSGRNDSKSEEDVDEDGVAENGVAENDRDSDPNNDLSRVTCTTNRSKRK